VLDGVFFVQQRGILLDEVPRINKPQQKTLNPTRPTASNNIQQNNKSTSNIYILLKEYIYLIYSALCFEKYFRVGLLDCWTLFSEIFFSIFALYVFFSISGGAGDLILQK
jgi:hypothetical protein